MSPSTQRHSHTCEVLLSRRGLSSLSCGPFCAAAGELLYTVNVFLCLLSMLAYEYIVNPKTANVQPTTILHSDHMLSTMLTYAR